MIDKMRRLCYNIGAVGRQRFRIRAAVLRLPRANSVHPKGAEQIMKCPACGYPDSKVIDSRPVEENNSIRRRRECLNCQKRFTTYEVIEAFQPMIIKKDGSKEYFDKNKILGGLLKACQKRPVDAEAIANEIEAEIMNSLRREIPSREIGELAMEKLKKRDPVAYVRFASVYREFRDVETFMRELQELSDKNESSNESAPDAGEDGVPS